MKTRGVPVVMYHAVGPEKPGWIWNHLVVPLEIFEGQMRILKEDGWTTITLKALHDHISGGGPLPPKPVVLTFDDGYLDNWVFAYPILKKYNHRAAIWVSTDFVDPRAIVRQTLEDSWRGVVREKDLTAAGFLSWKEMKLMVESGLVEIQSHGKTHTWYYESPDIVDFHRPGGSAGYVPPPWLGWNRHPERKYEYMTSKLDADVPYGTPIYRHGKSLAVRRYFEDTSLTERLVGQVSEHGGAPFFERERWRDELEEIVRAHPPTNDRFETEQEHEARIRDELAGSKQIIEKALGISVDFLCWPGGDYSPAASRVAGEAGYLATTTHFQDRTRRNVYGQNPREINRTGSCSPWLWRNLVIRATDPRFFLAILEEFNGARSALWTMRLYKLKYVLRHYVFGVD